MKFPYKQYACIFVNEEREIELVRALIKEMDAFEFDYLPKDLVKVWDGSQLLAYTGKFDQIDVDQLTFLAWKRGIRMCVIVGGGHGDMPEWFYVTDPVKEPRDA